MTQQTRVMQYSEVGRSGEEVMDDDGVMEGAPHLHGVYVCMCERERG